MNIKEFFTGTQEEKDASVTIKKLQQKKKPRKRDLDKIQRFQKIARKRFMRLALSTLLSLGFVGGVLASNLEEEKKEAPVSKKVKTPRQPLPTLPTLSPYRNINELAPPAKLRSTYDSGFKRIMNGIPYETNDPDLERLSIIKKLRDGFTYWAELRGDTYFSLEDGNTGGAWLTIIPPNHPQMHAQKGLVQIDHNHDLNAVLIKPVNITQEWAGIILIHELSHLYDRMSGHEPLHGSRSEFLQGEVDAYSVEIDAINHFTKGRFDEALVQHLEGLKVDDPTKLVAEVKTSPQKWHPVFSDLDRVINKSSPLSQGEGALRRGLYIIALGFKFIDLQNLESSDAKQVKKAVVEKIMQSSGHSIPGE